jgi:putative endonuclease
MNRYFVYVLSSLGRTLYVGVTNDLERRLYEHRTSPHFAFTSQYRIGRLVHFEETSDVQAELAREKQIESWRRSKKVSLIEATNPEWRDLAADWLDIPASAMSFRAKRGISTVAVTEAARLRDGRDSSSAAPPRNDMGEAPA